LVYCTTCHHNYCLDTNLAKDSDSNRIGAMAIKTRDNENKPIYKYGIISCYHHEHPASFPIELNEDDIGGLPSVTPASGHSGL